MTPSHLMALDDLIAALDAAGNVILDLLEAADDYDQRADNAIAAVKAAADYLHSLRYAGE
jgi:hypothetical protein